MSEPKLDTVEQVIGYGMFRASVQPPPWTASEILATLDDYGYVVVKLPEPFSVDQDGTYIFRDNGTGPFAGGNNECELLTRPGSHVVEEHPLWELSPEECVDIASQYLAAAKVASR